MTNAVRAMATLNAVFQVSVGLLSVVSPLAAAAAFKVDPCSPAMLALIRMFGGLLAASGTVSALVARNPGRDPGLIVAFAASLLVNVTADVVVIGAGELHFDQLAVGMLIEFVLAALLIVLRAQGMAKGSR